jgi:membrane protease YdiL (CAAX protease family)
MLMIFVDGIVLGLARHFSGSLYVPIAMHMLGNLFSIAQSLAR